MEVGLEPRQLKPDIDPSVVNRARNNFILNYQKANIWVVVVVIIIFTWVIKSVVPIEVLLPWAGTCCLTYFARYWVCHAFSKCPEEEKGDVKWERLFAITVIASGVVWGASAFLIFPEDSKNHQILLVLLIVFLSSGTIATYSAYKLASVGFTFACLLPFLAKFLLLEEEGLTETALFLVMYLVVMITSGKTLRRNANKIFLLSYENNKLIYDLQISNTKLTEKNTLLSETQAELREVNEELQKRATTDALTGLTNRRRFEALAKVKWSRCAEDRSPLSLMIINIDHFKQYNDFYGHRKGDSCLIGISEMLGRIPEINRSGDAIARYSGDEMAVLLVNADEKYAYIAAETIRKNVERLRISRAELPNEISPWLSVSVGIATEEEFRDRGLEELFLLADEALHKAKRGGRNRVNHSSQPFAA